jgi:hypothetical protein
MEASKYAGLGYTELGTSPLSIGEMYEFRRHCCTRGLEGFSLWAKFLLQCQLALREDELNDMKDKPVIIQHTNPITHVTTQEVRYNCLNWDTTVFNAKGEIEALGVTIKGKVDKQPVNFVSTFLFSLSF